MLKKTLRWPSSFTILVLVILTIVGLQGEREWLTHAHDMQANIMSTGNMVNSVDQCTQDRINDAEMSTSAITRLSDANGRSREALSNLDQVLRAQQSGRPRFQDVTVTAKDGQWRATASPVVFPPQLAFFDTHRNDAISDLVISPPSKDALAGPWTMTASRNFFPMTGDLAGVISAGINLSDLFDNYPSPVLEPENSSSVPVVNDVKLASYPSNHFAERNISTGSHSADPAESFGESYQESGVPNGLDCFPSAHRHDRNVVSVAATVPRLQALPSWSAALTIDTLITGGLIAALSLVVLRHVRQKRDTQAIAEQVSLSEALCRSQEQSLREADELVLLATESGAIALWEWDVIGDKMCWGPWMFRLFGMQPMEGLLPYALWRQQLHPDDSVTAEQALRDCLAGVKPYESEFRVIWEDGTVRHLSSSARLTRDPDGSVSRMIGATWDVTSKRVEEEQRAMILEEAQARIDALEEYQAVISTMVDGLIITDESGLIKTFTPVAERLFGYLDMEVRDRNIKILMPGSDHGQHDIYVGDFLSTEDKKITGAVREVTGMRKDGTTFPMDLGISVYKVGVQLRYVGIVRDVSQRKYVEEELRQREQSLQLAWRGTGVGMWDWNVLTNEMIFSDRFKELLGYGPDALPHYYDEWVRRLHPADRSATLEMLHAHINRTSIYDVEYRMITRSGEWRWFHANGQAIWDQDGRPVRMAGSLADITESKHQQKALKTSEETVRSAMEAAAIGMALVAPAGLWLMVNPALCELLGCSSADLLQTNFRDVVHVDDLPSCLESLDAMLAGDTVPERSEMRWIHRSGQIVWIHLSASLVRDNAGAPSYFVWQILDITERKHMTIMQDEFVSTVNHELRTPLSSIFAAIRLLIAKNADQLDAKGVRLLNIADEGCSRLSHLIDDILDLEKISAGKMDYALEKMDLGLLVQGIVDRQFQIADRYDVRFVVELEARGILVNIDPNRFSQSLVNLLSNAAKYSPRGDMVTIKLSPAAAGWVRVSVSDRGAGIPKSFHHKIFGRFAQADSSATRRVGGSGLGLNITKRIIEAFGGTVSFETMENIGTTFHFELPIYSADSRAA